MIAQVPLIPLTPPRTADKSAAACMCCSEKFTFINRKHHCRHCGSTVCGDCSNGRAVVLDNISKDPVRVCDNCTELVLFKGDNTDTTNQSPPVLPDSMSSRPASPTVVVSVALAPEGYTVLSQTYSAAKAVWTEGKNYKLISTAESLAESLAEKALSATARYTAVSSLVDVDKKLCPVLVDLDLLVSPYVVSGLEKGREGGKMLEPVLDVARKVLPVKMAETVAYAVYGTVVNNVESVGVALRMNNQETSTNPN